MDGHHIEPIEYRHNTTGNPWIKDQVIAWTVENQVEPKDGWKEINLDMRLVFDLVFSKLPSVESITVRGAQIYSESIGCFIDSEIDYVKMDVNS